MDLGFDRKRQSQHDEALRSIQLVDEPTMEPLPSKKQCKRAVFNIGGLQIISRDTPVLRCHANRLSVLLDLDFEQKDY